MRAPHLMKPVLLSALLVLLANLHLGCKSEGLASRDGAADLPPATGGVATLGGSQGSGGVTGAGGMGGAAGAGGATGSACLDSSGAVSTAVKSCATVDDCTLATIRTCCGSDLAVGLAKTANCRFPVPDCT